MHDIDSLPPNGQAKLATMACVCVCVCTRYLNAEGNHCLVNAGQLPGMNAGQMLLGTYALTDVQGAQINVSLG